MPIYAYRCTSCGHAKDVLQKVSDPLLTDCPACGAATFVKQVTAAGFQLKGSGWYVTDFRGGNTGAGKAEPDAAAKDGKEGADKAADKPADKAAEKAATSDKAVASSAPAASAAPAAPATSPSPPAASPPTSGS